MLDWAVIFSEVKFYVLLFAGITFLTVLTRGKKALIWSRDMKISAVVNFATLKFNATIGGLFFAAYFFVEKSYNNMSIPQLSSEVWEAIPAPLTWIILLLVYDMALYWVHRWLHSGWLWPMHAVHHSDTELHFLSWSRGHALEQTVIAIFVFLTSAWLGLAIEEIALLATLKALHQYYVHSNIDWDHGPLKLIIASPQYHRWHHADVEAAYDKNFASIFPFLDKLFGTYYHPHSAVDVPTGFPGSPKNDFVALVLYPFTEWTRMIKARFAKDKPGTKPVDHLAQDQA